MGSRIGVEFPTDHGRFIQAAVGPRPRVSSLVTELRAMQGSLTAADRAALCDGFARNLGAKNAFAEAVGSAGLDTGMIQQQLFGFEVCPMNGSTPPSIVIQDRGVELLGMTLDSDSMHPNAAAQLLSPQYSAFPAFEALGEEAAISKVADICRSALPFSFEDLSPHLQGAGIEYSLYNSQSFLRALFGFREGYYSSLVSDMLTQINPPQCGRILSNAGFATDGAAIALERFDKHPASHMAGVFGVPEMTSGFIVSMMNGHQARITEGRGRTSVWDMWAKALSITERAKAEEVLTSATLYPDVRETVLNHQGLAEDLLDRIIEIF